MLLIGIPIFILAKFPGAPRLAPGGMMMGLKFPPPPPRFEPITIYLPFLKRL
jgi:hypothetical protein